MLSSYETKTILSILGNTVTLMLFCNFTLCIPCSNHPTSSNNPSLVTFRYMLGRKSPSHTRAEYTKFRLQTVYTKTIPGVQGPGVLQRVP